MGHIAIARTVVKNFALDELLVIPAFKPPHKSLEAIAGSLYRYEMCVLALQHEPRIRVSKMEIELPERPYTIHTIERLRMAYGEAAQLFFVMGADSFAELTTWRDYQRLLASTNTIVVTRAGGEMSAAHLPAHWRDRVVDVRGKKNIAGAINTAPQCLIYLTDLVNYPVSSTEIRRRVQQGIGIEGLTEPAVIEYIETHNLYRKAQANP
ncbi:MAG: nicotinate (nicotinamide) nucleotide adenylyltransferase [Acidobacteria bacterium]|nr:nicotinate (nicotinamide) nucleotide adenylyltransferase [Acidobacteriota bacterium]